MRKLKRNSAFVTDAGTNTVVKEIPVQISRGEHRPTKE
jgi:hypothetical protein